MTEAVLVESSGSAATVQWRWQHFGELGAADLYALLALRQEVFVLEQRCLYADIDGMDDQAVHLLGWQQRDGQPQLVAYLRCFAPGVRSADTVLGRIVTARPVRGSGVGFALVTQGVAWAQAQFPRQPMRIYAQAQLEKFYRQFGFVPISAPYDEDGIEHIAMLRRPF